MFNQAVVDGPLQGSRWIEGDSVTDLRPRLASDVIRLRHNGWYVDSFQDEVTFGIVLRLPNKRGFLAGCSDPWNWPTKRDEGEFGPVIIDGDVYHDEDTAARCADQFAERYAEICLDDEREFQEEQERERIADEQQQLDDLMDEWSAIENNF
jgi:hypothetical protein